MLQPAESKFPGFRNMPLTKKLTIFAKLLLHLVKTRALVILTKCHNNCVKNCGLSGPLRPIKESTDLGKKRCTFCVKSTKK